MKQRTWPDRSDASPFSSFSLSNVKGKAAVEVEDDVDHFSPHANSISISSKFPDRLHASPSTSSSSQTPFFLPPSSFGGQDFSALPYDVLIKIAASFNLPNLRAASFVCKPWFEALRPLREAMLFLRWGKRFKHGRAGVRPNSDKALNSFLKAAARGSTLAMVDAGLLYWEMGNKGEAIALYQKAADLGDPAGKCNLGISFLHGILNLIPFHSPSYVLTRLTSRILLVRLNHWMLNDLNCFNASIFCCILNRKKCFISCLLQAFDY